MDYKLSNFINIYAQSEYLLIQLLKIQEKIINVISGDY